ncbi:MAG TPA: TatD family hydrolase [Vicinamibacterales bacterium]|nr:TatD family hydrolase [Vicinamibacterales bacterium]
MIDSHCHLADPVFAPDLEAVVERARAAGVTAALVILAAGDSGEAERAARVAALWDDVRFAVGVHPHQAHECAEPGRAAAIVRERFAADSRVRAVGEIGLDYHYDFSPRDVQRRVFAEQVALARELKRPVVIHTREAEADTFDILASEGGGEVTGVFHCFTGDTAMARRALDLGFSLSFAGIITFPKATILREAAAVVPADRLLVETDSPFLAPVPHRGQRNEPAHVARVIEAVAAARGEDVSAIDGAATANFRRFVGDS